LPVEDSQANGRLGTLVGDEGGVVPLKLAVVVDEAAVVIDELSEELVVVLLLLAESVFGLLAVIATDWGKGLDATNLLREERRWECEDFSDFSGDRSFSFSFSLDESVRL
jgi:hypothetical protein